LIGIISELVTEVKIKVSPENGMHLTALDPANVAMVYFNIPSELFSEFVADKEEILGVNLSNLKSILRRCGMGSSLTLETEDNTLKLGIQDKIKRDFTLALIDVEGEEKELPEWEFKSVVKMDSQAFVDAIEDCLVVSDACTFIAEPSKFIIEAGGLNTARAEFSSDEVQLFADSSSAKFSLEYLNKFIKGSKIASKVELNFSDNHPMRINFPSGKIMLSFVLAPRVEQDD
jgi:proliferating cell nuclear antigen